MRRLFAVLTWCLIAAYPVIVFFGLKQLSLGYLGGFFFAIAVLRLFLLREQARHNVIPLLLTLLLMLAGVHALLSGSPDGLRFYPVAVNAALLVVFAASLFQERTVIERIARLTEPNLPTAAVSYTRKVTIAWCGFFLFNGSVALYTVLYANMETWTLYNGLIAYLLMGLMFGCELLIRRTVKKGDDA